MKMKTVITAARKSIPELCENMVTLGDMLKVHQTMLSDLLMVESQAGRQAMRAACEADMAKIFDALAGVQAKVNEFAGLLDGYKRKFKSKKDASKTDDRTMLLPFEEFKESEPSVIADQSDGPGFRLADGPGFRLGSPLSIQT